MREKFKAEKSLFNIVPKLLLGLLLLGAGISATYFLGSSGNDFDLVFPFIAGGLLVYWGIASLTASYTITEEGLLAKKGLAKKLFRFKEIKDVRKASLMEVEEILLDLYKKEKEALEKNKDWRKGKPRESKEFKRVAAEKKDLTAYCTGKARVSDAYKKRSLYSIPLFKQNNIPGVNIKLSGNFVLLETVDGKRFLLNPKRAEMLVMSVKAGKG